MISENKPFNSFWFSNKLSLTSLVMAVFIIIVGLAERAHSGPDGPTTISFGPDLTANGWRLMTFPRRTPASFSAQGSTTLLIDANSAVAILWRQLKPALRDALSAQWRWRVKVSVVPTDLSKKGGDDRAVAAYFVFSDDTSSAESIDLSSIMRAGSAHILTYVWGGSAAKGQFLSSPYLGENGRTIVLRSASDPIGGWLSERVDLKSDYRKAFGRNPPALIAVAVSSDSDDTSGRNVAAISEFVLNPRNTTEKR